MSGGEHLGITEELPDQVMLAAHTSSHNSMGRDSAQVAVLVFIHRLPGVVPAEQLILVPVSLLWHILWKRKPDMPTVGALSSGLWAVLC